ncbi:cyclin domain-containing protein 2 [Danaus plexippus plexippus]|uniref:Cyclin domain-containing protein 2 n=1 Tax=Danaus plexippus plexippus TaxID=278856 RepID=A0A212F4B3_DANPL|nr:cyclin domain-containing protein 2 [Danaus plexippus plexippus]
MEVDKENIRGLKNKTKIPLPLSPLPAVPHNLLKRNNEIERHPLKTINRQDSHIAGTSQRHDKIDKNEKEKEKEKIRNKMNVPLNMDTRFVTIRQKTEDMDWNYNVFKDETVKENSIIVISDDEETSYEEKCKKIRYFLHNRQKNCLGDTSSVVTPDPKSPLLEPNRVRNIKKSLKRPHSRELQGISPITKQRKGEEKHKRRLQFNERLQIKQQTSDYILKPYVTYLDRDHATDLFTYLLSAEKRANIPRINSHTRSCIINWIIKVHGPAGSPSTVQYAQWYFDSMLAIGHIHIDQMQLFAAACYWIAQKIHGPYTYARKLVKCSSHAFSCEKLLAAEKAVLITLKFPRHPVIPQEFISYLSFSCDTSQADEIEEAATFLYTAGMMVDKYLCEIWPSVLAAAAVRNSILLLRKKEAIVKLKMNSIYKEAEKKTSNISYVCSIQRRAVRLISSPCYEYKALLVRYGGPPNNVAQKIVASINEFAALDARMRIEFAP